MALSGHQRMVIARANEEGYFPTNAQAKRIARLSCDLYLAAKNQPNPVDHTLMAECDAAAVEQVMEGDADRNPRHVKLV